MPYQLIHDGVVREFEFYPPIGWSYWLERAFTEDGRRGLPLIVALHGGGQSPENFAFNWPFPLLFNSGDNANWEDRCFVIYPYGFSYVPGLDGEPERGWSTGFSGNYLTVQNDVGFIKAMITAVEKILEKELKQLGIKGRAIDADRRFLFGYSMGGMMAYKLANKMPNDWGAMWVMSAAFGGRSHDGLTPTVTNPPQGRSSVSLFAHHGEADEVVPPGPPGDPSGLALSETIRSLYEATGLTATDAERYASSVRHLAAAVQTYRTYNNCSPTAYEMFKPDLPIGGKPDVDGNNDSMQYSFRQDGDPPNPEVTVYRDPAMTHANFIANRYFQPADVWQFFKDHPRVDL